MKRSVRYGLNAMALSLLLSACSTLETAPAQPDQQVPTASSPASTLSTTPRGTTPPSQSASPTPTATTSTTAKSSAEAEPACGPEITKDSLAKIAAKLPAPKISTGEVVDWEWDPDYAEPSTYDECADLSWITFPIEGATGSSPYIIALFNQGEYLGVATRTTFGFFPKIERVDDTQLKVTYTYAKGDDSNADASGRAISTYTWDASTKSVKHRGDFPPGYEL